MINTAIPSPSLALPLVASNYEVRQALVASRFARPLLAALDSTVKRGDVELADYQAAMLCRYVAQLLRSRKVTKLNTSLTASGLTAVQSLAAITSDRASVPVLRRYNAAMRRGDHINASQLAGLLRYRARSIHDDVVAHEMEDAMAALEARVYASNPQAGDWTRLKRRYNATHPKLANGTNGKADQ